jgi:putative transposase
MDRLTKRNLTRAKRQTQTCKVYEVKIDYSHLSITNKIHLSNLFKETKWFYNYCLSHKNINDANCTIKSVPVKVGEEFEDRKFNVLQTQHRQAIKERLFGSLKALSSLKKQGYKVGKLKFKSEVNSVPLREYKKTHCIDFENKRIKLSGMKKKWLKVNGLEQIPTDIDIANAILVKKCNDYYLHITTYVSKEETIIPETSIGIDFGCETQLSFSDGTKVKFQVPTSKKIKRLDCRIMRNNRPKSKKKEQDKRKRKIEYEYLTNKRNDIRHKIVNAITKNYKYVCFQDESIHAWSMSNHGKKIQFSGIGGIISDLKHKSHTPIMVNKFFPSTQLCPNCSNKQKLGLDERTYECNCGYINDRDIKSAICIEDEGIKQVPVDYRDFKAREILPNTFFDTLVAINGINVSKVESLN